jgi:hypothetical protein
VRVHWRRRTVQVLLVVAAITYSGLPWEAVAGFPLDPSRSYLSELAAADQQHGWLFRTLDAVTGALVLVALAVRGRAKGQAGLARASAVALAAFAILTIVDASSPMACATSSSPRCAAADAANALGVSHQIHTVSSAGALTAVVVSAGLLAIAIARGRTRSRPVERGTFFAVAGALVVVTVLVTVLALLSVGDGRLVHGGGLVQRAQTLLVSAYLVGFALLTTRRADPCPEPHADSGSVR